MAWCETSRLGAISVNSFLSATGNIARQRLNDGRDFIKNMEKEGKVQEWLSWRLIISGKCGTGKTFLLQ